MQLTCDTTFKSRYNPQFRAKLPEVNTRIVNSKVADFIQKTYPDIVSRDLQIKENSMWASMFLFGPFLSIATRQVSVFDYLSVFLSRHFAKKNFLLHVEAVENSTSLVKALKEEGFDQDAIKHALKKYFGQTTSFVQRQMLLSSKPKMAKLLNGESLY